VSFRPSRPASRRHVTNAVSKGIDALGGLLELRVRRPPSPLTPSSEGASVERWHDRDGRLAGYGDAEQGWLHLLGVGTFTFGPETIEVSADPDRDLDAIHDAHRRLALPLVLAALGHQVLHGSGVLMPQGVVALCAPSGSGKSTLAYGFTRRGLPSVADDAVALEPSGPVPLVIPLPFYLRLRAPSKAHFSVDGILAPEDVPREELPLAAVVILERAPVAAPDVQRLDPADAFRSVLAQAYDFGLADPARRRRMVDGYLSLASTVPVFRATVPDDLRKLDSSLDAIERAVASVGG
jgi:hypothetical protein